MPNSARAAALAAGGGRAAFGVGLAEAGNAGIGTLVQRSTSDGPAPAQTDPEVAARWADFLRPEGPEPLEPLEPEDLDLEKFRAGFVEALPGVLRETCELIAATMGPSWITAAPKIADMFIRNGARRRDEMQTRLGRPLRWYDWLAWLYIMIGDSIGFSAGPEMASGYRLTGGTLDSGERGALLAQIAGDLILLAVLGPARLAVRRQGARAATGAALATRSVGERGLAGRARARPPLLRGDEVIVTEGVPVTQEWLPVEPAAGPAVTVPPRLLPPAEPSTPTGPHTPAGVPADLGRSRVANDNHGDGPEPVVSELPQEVDESIEVPLWQAAGAEWMTTPGSRISDSAGEPPGSGDGRSGGRRGPPPKVEPGSAGDRSRSSPTVAEPVDQASMELLWIRYFNQAQAPALVRFQQVTVEFGGRRVPLTQALETIQVRLLQLGGRFTVEHAVAVSKLPAPAAEPARQALTEAMTGYLRYLRGQEPYTVVEHDDDTFEFTWGRSVEPDDGPEGAGDNPTELAPSEPVSSIEPDEQPDLTEEDLAGTPFDQLTDQLHRLLMQDLVPRSPVKPSVRTSGVWTVTASGQRFHGRSGTVDTIDIELERAGQPVLRAPLVDMQVMLHDNGTELSMMDLGGYQAPRYGLPRGGPDHPWPARAILDAAWEQVERLSAHHQQAGQALPQRVCLEIDEGHYREIARQTLDRPFSEIIAKLPEYQAVGDWAHSVGLTAQPPRPVVDQQDRTRLAIYVDLVPTGAPPPRSEQPPDLAPASDVSSVDLAPASGVSSIDQPTRPSSADLDDYAGELGPGSGERSGRAATVAGPAAADWRLAGALWDTFGLASTPTVGEIWVVHDGQLTGVPPFEGPLGEFVGLVLAELERLLGPEFASADLAQVDLFRGPAGQPPAADVIQAFVAYCLANGLLTELGDDRYRLPK